VPPSDEPKNWKADLPGEARYRWAVAASLLVGALLSLSPAAHWFLMLFTIPPPVRVEQLMEKVGDALFIGGVFAFLLDTVQKERLLTEIIQDVSGHIIGRLLPPALRQYVEDILRIPFIRNRWNIDYQIQLLADGFIQLSIDTDYTIKNLSSGTQKYHFVFEIERQSPSNAHPNEITFVDLGAGSLSLQELAYNISAHSNADYLVFEDDIEIGSEQEHKFAAKATQYFHPGPSFTPFISHHLVTHADVTVTFQPPFKVNLDLTSPFATAPQSQNLSSGKRWELTKPMIPGQGFFVRWNI